MPPGNDRGGLFPKNSPAGTEDYQSGIVGFWGEGTLPIHCFITPGQDELRNSCL